VLCRLRRPCRPLGGRTPALTWGPHGPQRQHRDHSERRALTGKGISEYDDEWGDAPFEKLETEFQRLLREHPVSEVQLEVRRPVKRARGRKAVPARKKDAEQASLEEEE
jgi:hypothetical protein